MPKTKQERINFIQRNVNKLPHPLGVEAGRLIFTSNAKMHESAEGLVVNADDLYEDTILLVYRYVKFALVAKGFSEEVDVQDKLFELIGAISMHK